MNKRPPILKKIQMVILSLFLFSGLTAVDTLWAKINIMPLGDSITYDNNIGDTPANRPLGLRTAYRQFLWLDLIGAGYDVDFVGSQIAGQDAVPSFDPDNEGHPGWDADGDPSDNNIAPNIFDWLVANPADVILLHIGTNDITGGQDAAGIASEIDFILDEIDRFGTEVWVVLAQIIKRAPETDPLNTEITALNNEIQSLADTRITAGDKLIVVNMENRLTYSIDQTAPYSGDMWDNLHPNTSGYDKMATAWFDDGDINGNNGLDKLLPFADAGPDQNKTEGDIVQLDGSFSKVPQVGIFPVLWEQTAGTPMVNISDPNSLTPTFTAPDVGPSGIILRFRLSISDVDNANIADTDFVDVFVNDTTLPPTETSCTDGIDNDGDGLTDCSDPDCASDTTCQAPPPPPPPTTNTVSSGGSGGGGGCFIQSAAGLFN